MTTPTLETHDVVLSDGTTTIGLIVAHDQKGHPVFSRDYAPSLSQQQFTSLTEAAFRPEHQAFVTQGGCEGGFGKQDYVANRYLQSFGTDASVKGLVYPGPVAVETTNTNPTQTGYNTGFETWHTVGTGASAIETLDSWAHLYVSGDVSYTKEATVKQAGTYAARNGGNADIDLRQCLGVTPVSGSIFTATLYGARTDAGHAAAIVWTLYDALGNILAGPQTDSITAGANTFQQKTFTYTFAGTKPNPVLRIQTTGTVNEVIIDTLAIVWTGTAVTTLTIGTIKGDVEFNGNHYFFSDTGLWKRTANDLAWVGGSPPGIIDASEVAGSALGSGGSALALCRGSSLPYWVMRTNETFVVNAGGAAANVEWWMVANSLNYTGVSPQTVYKMNDYLAASVTTTYSVGQTGYNITAMVNHLEAPYIFKENGGFYINSSGTVVEIIPEMRSLYNSNTGKNAFSWWGKLYVPVGNQGLLEYDAGDVVSVGPNHYGQRLSNFNGQIVATASDDEWSFVVLDNSAKIEILKGRWETVDGVTDFRWHPVFEDTYASVTWASVSSITAKRLWYGGGTSRPKYIPLPTKYGDPLNDTSLSFKTNTTHETSWFDYGLSNIDKTFLSFLLHSTGLSTGHRTIKVEYQLWGEAETTWTEVGGTGNGTFATSPTEEKVFAVGVRAKKIRFRFTLTTDDSAIGLGLISPMFTCYATINPPRIRMMSLIVRVADDNVLKNGSLDTEMSYRIVATQLHSWNSTDELTLTIPDGTRAGLAIPVKLDETFPKETTVSFPAWEPQQSMVAHFALRFIEQRTTSYAGPVTPEAYRLPTGRTATEMVAASTAGGAYAKSREQADRVGSGSNDAAQIQAALDA